MKKSLAALITGWLLAASPVFASQIVVEALLKDMAVISIDGRRYTITTTRPGPEGIRLIRSNSYEAVLEVNGVRGVYKPGGQPVTTKYVAPKAVTLRLVPNNHGMYMVSGVINGNPVNFLVDTGASQVAMNEDEGRRLGFDLSRDGIPVSFETASGQGYGRKVILNSVEVGGIRLHNVAAIISYGSHPRRTLLGMSFLRRIKMEREGSLMVLTQTHE